ncbi:MAG: Rrf2 family transcriptional regulator [Candidatus Tantalella remota]|nr:Rrf2 family transcriptional regulator [Candidatus Tantalella remota]
MLVTTKASYGVRALINLAIVHARGEHLSIRDIAKEEGISGVYLEQIFNRLKKCGIVQSVRGPKGGYMLAKDPVDISVYDAITSLEGGVAPVGCTSGRHNKTACKQFGMCASKEVWDEIARKIQETMSGYSLKYLAEKAIKKNPLKLEKEKVS